MELTIKLNLLESKRKRAHKKELELAIAKTHSDIVLHTKCSNMRCLVIWWTY